MQGCAGVAGFVAGLAYLKAGCLLCKLVVLCTKEGNPKKTGSAYHLILHLVPVYQR